MIIRSREFDPISFVLGKKSVPSEPPAPVSYKNAYATFDYPDDDIGEDGEYWYKLAYRTIPFLTSEPITNITPGTVYNEYMLLTSVEAVGIRVKFRSPSLYYSDPYISLREVDGSVLFRESVTPAEGWVYKYFDSSIMLSGNTNYAIGIEGNKNTLYKAENPVFGSTELEFVCGHDTSWPGYTSNTYYSVDLIINTEDPPFIVDYQYYKDSGAWTQINNDIVP